MACLRVAVLSLLVAMPLFTADGQTVVHRVTTTTLSLEPVENSPSVGTVVKLAARVVSNTSAIGHGLIKFCDADAVRCSGLSVLGMAQLDANGMATISLRLGPGTHRMKAVFCGTLHGDPPARGSTSQVQAITIK